MHPQIRALRATLMAALAQLDAMEPAEQDRPAAEPAAADSACVHRRKLSAGQMGKPRAWICADCNVEGDDGAIEEVR